ncbi:MAG TPA: malto-oligosyltrehalose synthase [Solirubrobacteraceae bacterium]|nr:malto-oligosyltrehalose synthase [Solirubrobacteraceae bacterium]
MIPTPPLRATYRLQLTPDFGFAAARERIPYLRDLGISHLYLSPSLQARAGSLHGYDVIDPTRISADLGGEREFRALCDDAHAAGLGIVLDLVPNHMATDEANRFWSDPELREKFFDIDYSTHPPRHRRFFDIDDLAGVRQEDAEVFEATHALVLSLVSDGAVDALRIDHPDGLADPAGYFRALRERGVSRVWIEKILEPSERLRDWPVTGTVGYEFLNDVCALFVDRHAEAAFTALWQEASGEMRGFPQIAAEAKLEQARDPFAADIERLAAAQPDVPGGIDALARAVASFPIYRTYVQPAQELVSDADREAVGAADMPTELREMLLLERPAKPAFVTRFQQTTPPVVAKGVEDTAFYRYGRLLALCDVGGDPARFGIDADRFHAANAERAQRFPEAMLTTMTHDTKRSSDVRARIAALTWMPDRWTEAVGRWLALTEPLRSAGAPDDLERYFIFQTLAGAWPIDVQRLEQYMEKALREAKRNTNWVDQNREWEEAVARFCRGLYEHDEFRADLDAFVRELEFAGERIALGTIALKLTAPGVPDIYQGDELPLRALVDPDNRRPVDWQWNETMLGRLAGGAGPEAETRKLWLTTRLLGLRIRRPEPFAGGYEPLDVGPEAVAYVRGDEVLVIVGTRSAVPSGGLRGVSGRWCDVLHRDERVLDGEVALATLLDEYGIAVLERT